MAGLGPATREPQTLWQWLVDARTKSVWLDPAIYGKRHVIPGSSLVKPGDDVKKR